MLELKVRTLHGQYITNSEQLLSNQRRLKNMIKMRALGKNEFKLAKEERAKELHTLS